MTAQGAKTCTVCGIEKPLGEFVKASKRPDGTLSHCKVCHNAKFHPKKGDKMTTREDKSYPDTLDDLTFAEETDSAPDAVSPEPVRACKSCGEPATGDSVYCAWCDPSTKPDEEPIEHGGLVMSHEPEPMPSASWPAIIETEDEAPLTRQEAQGLTRLIQESEGMKRLRVYVMWRYNGWAAMGARSFEDYCEKVVDTPRQTAREWINQVQVSIDTGKIAHVKKYAMRTFEKGNSEIDLLPQTITRPMATLKSPELRRLAWEQYEAISQGTRTPTQEITELKRITKRLGSTEEIHPNEVQPTQTIAPVGAVDGNAATQTPTPPAEAPPQAVVFPKNPLAELLDVAKWARDFIDHIQFDAATQADADDLIAALEEAIELAEGSSNV